MRTLSSAALIPSVRILMTSALLATFAIAAPAALFAQSGRGGDRPQPPQEAFDACDDSSEDDTCTVSFQGHTLNGTCREFPDGGLICAPEHMGPGGQGGHHGPPPEALEACEGGRDGDSCSVETPHGTLDGECHNTPDGQLACAPEGHRPPPSSREM